MFNKNFSKIPTEKQKLGQLGEDIACRHIAMLGYKVMERNYLKKWGEIDIIATKDKKIHFLEVKSVSRENISDVNHETNDDYRAEDNMHPWKLQRLGRAVQSYLLDRNIPDETDWQFDLVTVWIDTKNNTNRVFLLPDIVL